MTAARKALESPLGSPYGASGSCYLRKHLPSRSGSKHALMETLAAWESS